MWKKLVLPIVSLLSAALLAEVGVRLWLAQQGEAHRAASLRTEYSEILQQMTEAVAEPGGALEESKADALKLVVHPYAAYTIESNLAIQEAAVQATRAAVASETYDVFLLGGSVAAIFCGKKGGVEALVAGLRALPQLAGRRVHLYRLAIPGYKQPQQLTLLAYLLARGARPELVVNLDGLNELRQSMNNQERGAPPTWPAIGHWASVTGSGNLESAQMAALAKVFLAQVEARRIVARAERYRLAESALLGLWTRRSLERARSKWQGAQEEYVAASQASRQGVRAQLPRVAGEEFSLADAVACWSASSRAIDSLCRPLGIRYLHALQPTLHDKGSKVLTAEEERKGLQEGQYDERIVAGYELLRAELDRLQTSGITTADLSGIFRNTSETLYYDGAHFAEQGNQLLAEALLATLAAGL